MSGSEAQQSPRPLPPHDALGGGTPGHSGSVHPEPHKQGHGSEEIPPGGKGIMVKLWYQLSRWATAESHPTGPQVPSQPQQQQLEVAVT